MAGQLDPDTIPDRDSLAAYIGDHTTTAHADRWAHTLAGMPWRYVQPVIRIVTLTGNHLVVVLRGAAAKSQDGEFVEAAKAAIARYDSEGEE